jgi:hypothetical protein
MIAWHADNQRTAMREEAADVPALAALIGCDPAALQATLDEIRPGHTDRLGRRFSRALVAPYFAVKVTGALFHTQGGLEVDARCRVINHPTKSATSSPFGHRTSPTCRVP